MNVTRTTFKKRTLLVSALVGLIVLALAVPALARDDRNFRADLKGAAEVPPVVTDARGKAVFHVTSDGMEIRYKLVVNRIDDVTMAHIHMAPVGVNGGVVAWLYPSGPPPVLIPGTSNGLLMKGTITEADLMGALTGQPLSALVDAMMNGNAYVNVHTVANPGGEIRGQIE